jgi:hypothetical protein
LGGRGRRISEFEASLVYRMSSKTVRATQRNPVSKKKKKKKTNKQTNKQKKKKEKNQTKPTTITATAKIITGACQLGSLWGPVQCPLLYWMSGCP